MDLWITQLWITMSKPSIVMKNLMCASIVQQDMPPPCLYLHIVQECTEWIKQVIFDHLINYQIICEFDILFWHTVKFRYSEKGTNLKKIFHLWFDSVASNVKWKIFSNFVVFSEYINFKKKLLQWLKKLLKI